MYFWKHGHLWMCFSCPVSWVRKLACERGIWIEERPPSRFSRGSAAAVLHTDLLTGQLEQALVQVCDDLIDRVEALRSAEGRRIREAEAAALTRWARRGSMNSHYSEENE